MSDSERRVIALLVAEDMETCYIASFKDAASLLNFTPHSQRMASDAYTDYLEAASEKPPEHFSTQPEANGHLPKFKAVLEKDGHTVVEVVRIDSDGELKWVVTRNYSYEPARSA